MISASAVTLASRCLRRAAFKYGSDVEPAPEPESEAITLGKEGHAILEAYQVNGTSPPQGPLGDLCRRGLRWLPHPRQANAEGMFTATISGVPYLGYIDLESPESNIFPGITPGDGSIPAVVDYKFSKDPERFGVTTPEDFLKDPQALLYAAYSFVKYGTSRVFMRWLKFRTVGAPKVFAVDAILTRQAVNKAFGKVVHPYARTLVRIRGKNTDPNGWPPNYDACHDFGRPCPFMAHCKPRSYDVSLLDEMRNLVEAQAPNGAPSPEAQAAINPPAQVMERTQVRTPPMDMPMPALKVILEELGAAFTRAASRV
jgi:hypothetical protein